MKKSSALTLTCFAIASLIAAGCGDDATESTPSECTGEGCDEQPEVCNPACEEGDICRNGHCYTCNSSGKCYLNDVIIDDRCETKDDCEAGMICQDGDCLPDPNASACDPACVDGQVCTNGTCVNATLLWTLCQSDSDCGITNGTCTFTVAPSKPMTYKGKKYGNGENIPVNLLDERINTENYNATHKFAAAATSTIGICTQNCSTKNECEEGFTCQLVAEADPIYPTDAQLPVDLPQDDLAKPGFAAICRRVMNEKLAQDMPYNAEFCHQDEEKCKAAGGEFVDGMCLDSCDPANNQCPYTFSCENVGGKNVCMPHTHTCTACHDDDKDGYGYGHCVQQGIDCDDANPDVHYNRTMTCADVADKTPTDLNCNGLIDYFEMVGTPDNCNACGDTCYTGQSDNTQIECIPSNGVTIDEDWRKTASFENTTKLPEFTCVLNCDFGWGNCYDTDKPNSCETQLYNDKTADTELHASAVNGNATVWGADYDGDGYIGVNTPKTRETGDIVFNGAHTLLCCNTDTDNKCYEANEGWKSVTRPTNTIQVENIKSPSSYDVNDEDATIHPNEPEHCDGRDNDGSLILAQSPKLPDCKTYCALPDIDCKSLKIEVDGKYEFNAYCDATVDGSAETSLWYDTSDKQSSNKGLGFGDTCSLRHTTNEVCDPNAIVSCSNMQEVRCYPGTDHCACSYDPNTGIVQYLTDAGYLGRLEYKVKNAMGEITTTLCQCDGTDTDETCIVQCNTFCVKKYEKGENSYALACTANLNQAATSEDPGATTVKKDGMDDKGNLVFDGYDDNCNGIPDDDAMLPCLITLTDEQAPYNYVDASGQQFGYITGVSNDDATRYSLYRNYADHENYDRLFESDEKSAIRNADGSINICRLGWLQPNKKLVTDASGNASYTYAAPKCVPLFEPRQFDFMGDGVDSNCDGVDYDLQNAVYVANSNVQLSTGSICKGSACKCDYHAASTPGADRYPTPCDSLTTAIKVAPDDARFFYKDIIILNSETISLSSGIEVPRFNKQPNLPTAQLLTTLTDASLGESAAVNHYNLVEGSTKLIRNGHILSPYALHREFIRRKLQGEDINQYLFAYEKINDEVGVDTVEGYEHGAIYEKLVPDEQVRIFGGFQATYKAADAKPWVPKAQWNASKGSTSSIDYTINTVNAQTYAMFAPPATTTNTDNRLSLGLYNLKLTMQATSTQKAQLNGTTFTGINGYQGIEKLTFKQTTLDIKAPSGYSFTNDESDLIVTPNRPKQAKSGSHEAVCEVNTDALPTNSCDFGVKDVKTETKSGGAGGRGGYSKAGCSSPSPTAGQQGSPSYFYDVLKKIDVYTTAGGQGGVLEQITGGCAHDDWGDEDFNKINSQGNPGSQGDPGTHGAFGESTKKFSWTPKIVNKALYIDSDRSGGRGYYGGIGSGGGGGGVFRCVKQHGAANRSCYAANGGTGGCGGEGGEAGGTGGSAFGIVARSTSATSQTVINFDETSKISVTNGIGGSSQLGALGQSGGMGGNHNGYAREKHALAWYDMECIRSACGGGGGAGGVGGSGAAGHVGWPFPLVLICEVDSSKLSDLNVSEIGGQQLKSCGFNIDPRLANAEQDNKDNGAMAVTYQKVNYNKCDKNFVTTLSLKSNITPISSIVDIPLTPVEDFTVDGLTRDTHYYGKDNFSSCEDPLTKATVNIEFCGSAREKKCVGQDSVYPNMPTVCTPVDTSSSVVDQSMLTSGTHWAHQYIKVLSKNDLNQKVESDL